MKLDGKSWLYTDFGELENEFCKKLVEARGAAVAVGGVPLKAKRTY
jgi:hypothetical protein